MLCPNCHHHTQVDDVDPNAYRILVATIAHLAEIIGDQHATITQLTDTLDEQRHRAERLAT